MQYSKSKEYDSLVLSKNEQSNTNQGTGGNVHLRDGNLISIFTLVSAPHMEITQEIIVIDNFSKQYLEREGLPGYVTPGHLW